MTPFAVLALLLFSLLPWFLLLRAHLAGIPDRHNRRLMVERLHRETAIQQRALREATRVLWSYRDIFDHYGRYVAEPSELHELMFRLGHALPNYVGRLPSLLQSHPADGPMPPLEDFAHQLGLPGRLDPIDGLVRRINDPVLDQLWAIRTPIALADMLRHAFFLSLGYPYALTGDWEGTGVGIPLPVFFDPPGGNFGALTKEALGRKACQPWAPRPHGSD